MTRTTEPLREYRHRYLVIDDDPGDIEILRRLLEGISAGAAEVTAFTDVDTALSELDSTVDLIFVDYLLGEKTGLEVFAAIRDRGCECPVVLLTGQGSEQVAVDAMKAGVADYVVKGSLSAATIDRVVVSALAKFALEQQVKQHQQRLADKVRELEEALDHVKTLEGLLPICMHCKKIRDDQGSWDQIEEYIAQRSNVNFSHGICPECLEKHYPRISSRKARTVAEH